MPSLASRKRGAASCLPSLSASCLGLLRRLCAIHGYTSATLTTPGLRSGTPVRSPFAKPHCAFPPFGRFDPATDGVARRASLRAILRRAASCRRACSCGGHPGRRAFGECALVQRGGFLPKDCDALRVRRCSYVAMPAATILMVALVHIERFHPVVPTTIHHGS